MLDNRRNRLKASCTRAQDRSPSTTSASTTRFVSFARTRRRPELLELGEQKPIGRQRPAARGVAPKLLHRFGGERQNQRACRGGRRVRMTIELLGHAA